MFKGPELNYGSSLYMVSSEFLYFFFAMHWVIPESMAARRGYFEG